MLDEPTNHLDIESIDALGEAIANYNGGLVLVSHDFRLISKVANEIWICENQTVTKWNGTIQEYKDVLKANVLGTDGKKKDMCAASADHYNKPAVEVPAAIKAPVKKMQILNITSNKKPSPVSTPTNNNTIKSNGHASPPKQNGTGKKFVPPGKRQEQGADEDWW
jgi:energy-coupling factor transporter ATP-binding protein EcfA2